MQTTLTQAARDFQPVPDLSAADLEWWAETSAANLTPATRPNDPQDFAQDWEEYDRWSADLDARRGVSMDVEDEAPRYVVRSPETLAEHASQWAAYQRRAADVRRWVS